MSAEHHGTDPALAALGALPAHDLDLPEAERIRRRARSVLAHQRRLARRPWLHRADRVYSRWVEPTLVAATVSVYLLWAFQTVLALRP